MPVTFTAQGECTLPPDVHVALYRIAQEGLNNVIKHARASQVTVSLQCGPPCPADVPPAREGDGAAVPGAAVELSIRDNGRGFDPDDVPPDRLGLGIMRERAQAIGARLTIESRPEHGTSVTVMWEGNGKE